MHVVYFAVDVVVAVVVPQTEMCKEKNRKNKRFKNFASASNKWKKKKWWENFVRVSFQIQLKQKTKIKKSWKKVKAF